MTVFRSNANLYCQIIDDQAGCTLVSASTRDKDLRGQLGKSANKETAQQLGKIVAERALAAGITQVCFDRGRYKYHGRVAELAAAAREAGLCSSFIYCGVQKRVERDTRSTGRANGQNQTVCSRGERRTPVQFCGHGGGGRWSWQVGWGYGKANEVPPSVDKATKQALRTLVTVSIVNDTIPHVVMGRCGASKVLLIRRGQVPE
jgi:large subunit ribosomal protein L18